MQVHCIPLAFCTQNALPCFEALHGAAFWCRLPSNITSSTLMIITSDSVQVCHIWTWATDWADVFSTLNECCMIVIEQQNAEPIPADTSTHITTGDHTCRLPSCTLFGSSPASPIAISSQRSASSSCTPQTSTNIMTGNRAIGPTPCDSSSSPPTPTASIPSSEATQEDWLRFNTTDHLTAQDPIPTRVDLPTKPSSLQSAAITCHAESAWASVPADPTAQAGGFDGEETFPSLIPTQIPTLIPAVRSAPPPKWSWTSDRSPRISADGHVWPGVPNALYHNYMATKIFIQVNACRDPTPIIGHPEVPECITSCDWLQGYPNPHPRPTPMQRRQGKARKVAAKVRSWVRRFRHPSCQAHGDCDACPARCPGFRGGPGDVSWAAVQGALHLPVKLPEMLPGIWRQRCPRKKGLSLRQESISLQSASFSEFSKFVSTTGVEFTQASEPALPL